MAKRITFKQICTQLWQWINNYFTLRQTISTFGGSAMMSSILSSLTRLYWSLSIVEQIFIGIGLTLILTALIMFIWSRFIKRTRQKRQKHREWIALNMPHLAELRITLARINQVTIRIANALSKKDVSYNTIEKCNKYYVEKVKAGLVNRPFGYINSMDIGTARKLWKKTIHKVGRDMKKLIEGMNVFAEVMEKYNIGLYPAMHKDEEYIELSKKLVDLKAVANPAICSTVSIYESASYGSNISYMFYVYWQRAVAKKAKREHLSVPIEYRRPPQMLRMEIDKFLSVLLSNVEEAIEENADEGI